VKPTDWLLFAGFVFLAVGGGLVTAAIALASKS